MQLGYTKTQILWWILKVETEFPGALSYYSTVIQTCIPYTYISHISIMLYVCTYRHINRTYTNLRVSVGSMCELRTDWVAFPFHSRVQSKSLRRFVNLKKFIHFYFSRISIRACRTYVYVNVNSLKVPSF